VHRIAAVTALLAATSAAALAAPAGDEERASRAPSHDLLVIAALSPERAIVADPLTGAVRERELAGGTLCHGPLLGAGDRVIVSGERRGRSVALSLPLSLAGPGRPLGAAEGFVASTTPGRVWLSHGRVLREVGGDGRVHARATHRLGMPLAAVEGGFVSVGEHGLVLADGSVRDGWLVAARDDRVAWCREGCRSLQVGDRTLRSPWRIEPGDAGGFSPDGRRLALPVRADEGSRRLAIIDLADGTWRLAPGARLGDYGAGAWSSSSDRLYFATATDRLRVWRLGARRTDRLPIDTDGTVMSIAVLSRP
jgi:hypothetical protein